MEMWLCGVDSNTGIHIILYHASDSTDYVLVQIVSRLSTLYSLTPSNDFVQRCQADGDTC